jgi:hypothetical protein
MSNLKKHFIFALFILCAGIFAAGSASAQTWSILGNSGEVQNPCITSADGSGASTVSYGYSGQCRCPQGYTYGTANNANCTMDGFVPGCWNPGTGKCNTCGQGGTVTLGNVSCFSNGQSNAGGNGAGTVASGIACIGSSGQAGSSSQCVGSGTSTGGFSTN